MDIFIDKLVLLLLSLLSLLLIPFDSDFVIACFTAITFTALLYAFPDDRFQVAAVTFFSCLLFLRPNFLSFLPLLIYDYFPVPQPGKKLRQLFLPRIPAALLLIIGLLWQFRASPDFARLFFLISSCLAALLLRIKTTAYAALSCRFRQTMDNDAEIKLLLKEKNQTLLEKQNSEIYAATLQERNRIAREIHDNVGHMLTRSILMVGALKTINKESAMAGPLNQLEATLNQSMSSVRTSVHDLHDNSINLEDALRTMVREFSYCPIQLDYSMSVDIPRNIKYSFISIAREALSNIARHSNATSGHITAMEHPGFYQFIVQDNGAAAGISSTSGIGLANIRSRVEALNGNLRIKADHGFRIYITVPKRDNPSLGKCH